MGGRSSTIMTLCMVFTIFVIFKSDTLFARFLRHAMTLHTDSDHIHLVTDPTLIVIGPEGRPQGIVPYRLGVPPMNMRRDTQGVMRPFQTLPLRNGNPLIVQQLKKMQPPTAAPQMRISSGGGMRPPSVSLSNMQQLQQQPAQFSAGCFHQVVPLIA